MRWIRPDRLFLGTLSTCLALYALLYAHWNKPGVLIALLVLTVVTELFPARVGKSKLALSFPILYAMTLVTGLEASIVLLKLTMVIVQMVTRQPVQSLLYTCLLRAFALLLGGLSARAFDMFGLSGDELPFLWLHLTVFLLVYTGVAVGLNLWRSAVYSSHYRQFRIHLLQAAAWHLLISFLYSGFMHWISSQGSGSKSAVLGAVFFFSPLAAASIVIHLITNLSHTKSKLETLFAISQSIGQTHDLQKILEQVIREATRLVHGSYGVFYLVKEDGSLHQVTSTTRGVSIRFPKGSGLVGLVAGTGETLLVPDVTADPRLHPGETHASVRTLLLVPIHIDDKVAAVMSLGKRELDPFQTDDLKLLRIFATQAAVVMKRTLMAEEREKRLLLEERNRLAREIHDGLAQDLAGIIFQVDLLKRSADAQTTQELNGLQEVLRKSVATVRHSIYSLRPAPYAQLGLVPSMRQQLEDLESQHRLSTHFTVQLPEGTVPTPIAKAVYQVFNEAVQNVVKHAKAKDLFISLCGDEEALTLSVRDNGAGFHFGKAIVQAAARHSFGIENLHSVADEIGGTLDYVTAPGMGTEVTLRIPLKEEEDDDDSPVAL